MILFFIIFTIILFNPTIYYIFKFEYIKLIDDVVLVVLFFILLFNITFLINKKNIYIKKIIIYSVLVSLIGTISLFQDTNVFSFKRLIIGYLFFMKPFILLVSGIIIGYRIFRKIFISYLYIYILGLFSIIIIASLIDFFFPSLWFNIVPPQYFGSSLRLRSLFTNAGRTSWMMGMIIIFLISYSIVYKGYLNKIKVYLMLPMVFFFLYFTYVKKTLLGIIFSVAYINFSKKLTVIRIILFLFVLMLFLFIFQDQFSRFFTEYSFDKMTYKNSRIMLFVGAYELIHYKIYKILFGLGFGTWGGYASSIVYSPYYYDLGFNKLWGFIPGSSSYTGDNYIAHIIAEIGIIGTFLLLKLYYWIFKLFSNIKEIVFYNKTSNKERLFALFFLLAYIELLFELLGICADEISSVSYFVFFLSGIYIGLILKRYNQIGKNL